jgi:hypothetical protein
MSRQKITLHFVPPLAEVLKKFNDSFSENNNFLHKTSEENNFFVSKNCEHVLKIKTIFDSQQF